MTMKKVSVLGAGSWGTALAIVLADNGHEVTLWTYREAQAKEINETKRNERYLDSDLPMNLTATSNLKEAVTSDTEAIIIVVPTSAMRQVCGDLNPLLTEFKPYIIHASKGIEPKTFKRVSEIISEELTNYKYEDIVVLSGPSHAEEVAKRLPTTVTVSSMHMDQAEFAQNLFINEAFRVYTSTDLIGIELGGALKNIIALGAGISDGLGFGDNAKAALITRGLAEITRLGVSLGANPLTFLGLPGVGDLIVTCTSVHSRNWRAGNLLGKGRNLQEVLDEMGMVVEGVRTAEAASELAKQQNVEMPITAGIADILFAEEDPAVVVKDLMSRERKGELEDFSITLK